MSKKLSSLIIGTIILFTVGHSWGFEAELNGWFFQRLHSAEEIEPRVAMAMRLAARCEPGAMRKESLDGWSYMVYPLTCRLKITCGHQFLFETTTHVEGIGSTETIARRDALLKTLDLIWPAARAWAVSISQSLMFGEMSKSLQQLEEALSGLERGAVKLEKPSEDLMEVLSKAVEELGEESQ